MSIRVVVLGGYGNTGLPLCRLLLKETDVRLAIAGRNLDRARQTAAELNAAHTGERVSAARVDAADRSSVKAGLAEADFVVAASSTARYAQQVADAALAAGVDYLDIHYSPARFAAIEAMAPAVKRAGRCFVTEAGYHPGLPAAMIRCAAAGMDAVRTARVSSMLNQFVPLTGSVYELIAAFRNYDASFWRDGRWRKPRWWSTADMPKIDFGGAFGVRTCYPMMLEELRPLPTIYPGLREAGFYMASLHWFVDFLLTPLLYLGLKLAPELSVKPLGKLLCWSLKTFLRPPWGVVAKAEVSGASGGVARTVELNLFHEDGYMFTAIPVVACLRQYLDGTARKPGVWMMGHLADPVRLLQDMERMGVRVNRVER